MRTVSMLGLSMIGWLGVATALASPLDSISIGISLEAFQAKAGSKDLSSGGPDSSAAKHFELSGPLASQVSGSAASPLYLVFERAGNGYFLLTYVHWRMSEQQEAILLGNRLPHSNQAEKSVCARVSVSGVLAVRASASSWEREAVLEPDREFTAKHGVKGNQVRPLYVEICPNGPY